MGKLKGPDVEWRDPSEGKASLIAEEGDEVGLAWFDPMTFKALKRVDPEFAAGCESWEDWFASYQLTFRALQQSGRRPHKVPIKAKSLGAWLSGRPCTHELRLEFLHSRLVEVLRSSNQP
ncbi:MAG: hypothetical protein KC561_09865 [Myxococcales bacterium]|nr:hypothetical protein [Myxococcales bacterium]